MQRNRNLALSILQNVAEHQAPAGISSGQLTNSLMGTQNVAQAAQLDGYIDLIHHLDLLLGAGYLFWRGRTPSPVGDEIGDPVEPTFYHLTWTGHDLLEKLRADKSLKMLDL